MTDRLNHRDKSRSASPNRLFYGDNMDVLRRHIDDESVDLVYLDPPFKSDANYNVLFAEHDGTRAASQLHAFEDTWQWNEQSALAYQTVVEQGGRVSEVVQAFHTFLGQSDMMAYLSMMAPRLVELRRVLKPTGSIYLHCDSGASHYLKMLMDGVFGPENFKNEIVWKRTSAHSSAKRYGPVHDVILFYGRTGETVWIGGHQPYEEGYVKQRFGRGEERPWKDADLTGAGVRHGETGLKWRGFDVTGKGRHWAYPPSELDRLDSEGSIYWPKKKGGWPRLRKYLDDTKGVPLQDVWTDICPLNSQAKERLGYPTQKPTSLLERIISSSTNENDVVLDPFCGCGTTIAAAHRLKRRWIGIDITQAAIVVIKQRFRDHFGVDLPCEIVGEPVSDQDAEKLASTDPYQFQWWTLGLVEARPTDGKKGADKGIDGRRYFVDPVSGKTEQIVFSVKAGKLQPGFVRDLRGVVDREKAAMGALLCMERPTKAMRAEAASAGFVKTSWGEYPRLQIVTVGELLSGRALQAPPARQLDVTHKRAPKVRPTPAEQQKLPIERPTAAMAGLRAGRARSERPRNRGASQGTQVTGPVNRV